MTADTQRLLGAANRVLVLTEATNNEAITSALRESIDRLSAEPDLRVLLYGVSQAGKSSLVSMVTLGEEYVPVGHGTATTAAVIEVIGTDQPSEQRAEITLLAPRRLYALAAEPLIPFIEKPPPSMSSLLFVRNVFRVKRPQAHEDPSSGGADIEENDQPTLGDLEVRKALEAALNKALRHRRVERNEVDDELPDIEGGITAFDDHDLLLTREILSHYEAYERLVRAKEGLVFQVPLTDVSKWTRHPLGWGLDPAAVSVFEDVVAFFVDRVHLYCQIDPVVRGVRLIDAPGFGVSALHDRISREIQESSDAVLLLLGHSGSEISEAQLEQVRQLTYGLRGSVFLLWNPKSGTRHSAKNVLDLDLKKIRFRARIDIPDNQTAISHLRLALRSRQLERILESDSPLTDSTVGTLAHTADMELGPSPVQTGNRERAIQILHLHINNGWAQFDPIAKSVQADRALTSDALEASNWSDSVSSLFEGIRAKRLNPRAEECASRALDSALFYLAQFPIPAEVKRAHEVVRVVRRLYSSFDKEAKEASHRLDLDPDDLDSILREIVESLREKRSVLKASVDTIVANELYQSTATTKVQAKVADYMTARVRAWCASFNDTKSEAGFGNSNRLISETSNLQGWLKGESNDAGIASIDVPDGQRKQVDFSDFFRAYDETCGILVTNTLGPEITTKFMVWVSERGQDTADYVKDKWHALKTLFTDRPREAVVRRPRFDQQAAKVGLRSEIDKLLNEVVLKAVLILPPATFAKPTTYETAAVLISALGGTESYDARVDMLNRARAEAIEQGHGPIKDIEVAVNEATRDSFHSWNSGVKQVLREFIARLAKEDGRQPIEQSELEAISDCADAVASSGGQQQSAMYSELCTAVERRRLSE